MDDGVTAPVDDKSAQSEASAELDSPPGNDVGAPTDVAAKPTAATQLGAPEAAANAEAAQGQRAEPPEEPDRRAASPLRAGCRTPKACRCPGSTWRRKPPGFSTPRSKPWRPPGICRRFRALAVISPSEALVTQGDIVWPIAKGNLDELKLDADKFAENLGAPPPSDTFTAADFVADAGKRRFGPGEKRAFKAKFDTDFDGDIPSDYAVTITFTDGSVVTFP